MKIRARIESLASKLFLVAAAILAPITSSTAQDLVGAELSILAQTGQPAPGGGVFSFLQDPIVGGLNQFGFVGQQTGPSASPSSAWTGVLGSPVTLLERARYGQPAPGYSPNTFSAFLALSLAPNSSLAFSAGVTGEDVLEGLWQANPSDPIRFVNGPFEEVIPGYYVTTAGPPDTNSSGTVVGKVVLTDIGLLYDTQAIIAGTAGNVTPILKVGDIAPGIPGNWPVLHLYGLSINYKDAGTEVAINDSGAIAFGATVDRPDYGEASVIFYGQPQALSPVAIVGSEAPGIPGWIIRSLFPQVGLSENGLLAFAGRIESIETEQQLDVLFAGPASAIGPVIFEGTEVVPGSGATFEKFGNVAINQQADMVFSAQIRYPNVTYRPSIWIKRAGETPVLLAATGVPFTAPDGSRQPASAVYFAGNRAFNDSYQAAFRIGFGGGQSLFLAQIRPGIPVVRVTAPGHNGQVTQSNSILVAGTANNLSGIDRVEYTVTPVTSKRRSNRKIPGLRGQNKRTPAVRRALVAQGTRVAQGTNDWSFTTPLTMGENEIRINAIDVLGGISETVQFSVIRYSATPQKRLPSAERRKLLRRAENQAKRLLKPEDRLKP